MKTVSNKITTSITISLALVLTMVTPAFAIANNSTNKGAASASCDRVTALQSTQQTAIANRLALMRTDFANRLAKLGSKDSGINQKVTTARETARKQFEEKITTMLAQEGLTDAQKQAITTFQTSMEQAKVTRETAVDKARSDYRTALANLIQTRQQTMITAGEAFQASITAAFDTAISDCSKEGNMTTLRASIKTARATFTAARISLRLGSQIQELATTRNTAVTAANKAFADSVQTYAATLTAALATSTDSTN